MQYSVLYIVNYKIHKTPHCNVSKIFETRNCSAFEKDPYGSGCLFGIPTDLVVFWRY